MTAQDALHNYGRVAAFLRERGWRREGAGWRRKGDDPDAAGRTVEGALEIEREADARAAAAARQDGPGPA